MPLPFRLFTVDFRRMEFRFSKKPACSRF